MSKPADSILEASVPSTVADAVARIAGEAIAAIEASMPRALAGEPGQARAYVDAHSRLAEQVLAALGEAAAPPRAVGWLPSVLRGAAMSAPFSPWVGSAGPGRGAALALVGVLRQSLAAAKPMNAAGRRHLADWDIEDGDVVRFHRAVGEALEEAEAPLDRIRAVLGLNRTELAALFGVKRQALERWDVHGVPAERQAKLATLGAIADLLGRELKTDRIAGVLRRPAAAYGNRSILEAIAAGAEEDALAELRDAFDWASAA